MEHLWPGFAPTDFPVAVFDGADTWLYRHPNPPEEFCQGLARDGAVGVVGRHSAVVANTAVELGGEITATILHGNRPDTYALIAHETFHVYCRRQHPGWAANEAAAVEYPVDDIEALTLRHLEAIALRQAVLDTSPAWAAAAMDLRRQRAALLPAAAYRYERDLERWEGLAQYVEGRAAGRMQCMETLAEPLRPDAIDLDDLLTASVAATPSKTFSAEERGGVEDRAGRAIAAMKAERQTRRATFLARKDTVILTAPAGKPFTITGFDPMNILHLGNGEVLHTRWIKIHGQDGAVEMLNGEALTEAAGSHPLFDGIGRITLTKGGPSPRQ